jgi:hypothetical protein
MPRRAGAQEFVIEDMAVTVFDFGNCGSVELNPEFGAGRIPNG